MPYTPRAALTQRELTALLRVITSRRDRAIFLTAYRYGLRAHEIGLMEKDDVNFAENRITINRGKGSLSGVYPLHPDVAKKLRSYLHHRTDALPYLFISNRRTPIDRRTLWHWMKKYGELAGVPEKKCFFHILKHSLAVHLTDAGADPLFLKDWLGHANIQNTMKYARMSTVTRDEKARKFFHSPHIV